MSIDTSAISTNSRSSRCLTSFGGREAAGLKGPCVPLVVATETDVPMVAIPAGVGVVAAAEAAAKISRLVAAAGLGVKVGIPLTTEDPESVG